MRKLFLAFAAVAALAVAGPVGAATKTINIYGYGFNPNSVTVTEGDTVTWVNRDNANHQVLATQGEFVSAILKPRQTFSFTFKAPGTYSYKDELYPRHTGKIVVKGLPPTLTLAVSAPIVVYGTQATLSGVISTHEAGQSVTIYYQPYPQPNLIQRATVLTAPGGVYSFIIEPQVLTSYEAAWKGAFATPTTVQVQPKLTLGRNSGWIIHAAGGRSFAGRAVQFQRLNSLTGQWVTLKKVLLNSRSSARVIYALPKGTNHLRVTMSVNQAGAGFLGAISPTVTWHQT
ncbi:MAG TPA: cupredoxin domain-containing protein [Gaiellaceae bacterium]|jgi:plastocyanin|nr:cupredoxin domain-containing protein [Gaiellaceae bacterium]